MRILLFAICIGSVGLVGCTGDSDVAHGASMGPSDVTREWIEAATEKDQERFLSYLTEAGRKGLASDDGFDMTEDPFESPEIGKAVIDGDQAEVSVTATRNGERQTFQVQMRKESRLWRVYGIKVPMGDAGSISVNFENFGSMMQQFAENMATEMAAEWERSQAEHTRRKKEEQRVAYESLQGISLEDFQSSWTNNRDYRGQSTATAIEALASQLGFEVHFGSGRSTFEQPVTQDVRGMSRMEAIELLTAECDHHPVYPTSDFFGGGLLTGMGQALGEALVGENSPIRIDSESTESNTAAPTTEPPADAMTFASGTRPEAAVHTGPFFVRVSGVEERVPYARGKVSLTISTHGLHAGTTGLIDNMNENIRIGAITTGGSSLKLHEDTRYMGGGTVSGGSYESNTSVDLKNLLRGVSQIDRIEGTQSVMVPLEVAEATFASPKRGATHQLGDLTLEFTHVGTNTSVKIKGPEQQVKALTLCARALDSSGEDVEIHHENTSSWMPGQAEYSLGTAAAPSELRLKLVTKSQTLEFPFELRNVPLPKHREEPASLPTLRFSGNSPVTVRFKGFAPSNFDMPNAKLEVTNHTNKDMERVQATFVYLDSKGNVMKDFPHTLSGTFTMNGAEPIARAGAKENVESTAFFCPDGCKSMRVKIDFVEFMDGTRWEHKQ